MTAEFISQLRRYAEEAVNAARADLEVNLRRHTSQGPMVLDVALPGAAYFSVAAGGMADVLHFLRRFVQVDRFVGASGGACSLFLILANDKSLQPGRAGVCPDAEELIRSYLMYAESEGTGSLSRWWNASRQIFAGVSNFWERRYEELLQDERAWTAVRQRAFCAVSARPMRQNLFGSPSQSDDRFHCAADNYIMHSFTSHKEVVQSFVATGEATIKGFAMGIPISGEDWALAAAESGAAGAGSAARVKLPASFCDGGHPVTFNSALCPENAAERQRNFLLYYATWFENASDCLLCSPESIERLYKRGVDRTIACLLSPSLMSPAESGSDSKDKMIIIAPDADLDEELGKLGKPGILKGGTFVDLSRKELRPAKAR
ncbi:unnamed protein product [Effrenium voratum]|uniref:Uncharacterized protein n=1 Tax=Effrenium voratum TaxID=2562239 RepID=A0AA36JGF7_9DINO|nr:unnamed protein product [Effrenium voratum]